MSFLRHIMTRKIQTAIIVLSVTPVSTKTEINIPLKGNIKKFIQIVEESNEMKEEHLSLKGNEIS